MPDRDYDNLIHSYIKESERMERMSFQTRNDQDLIEKKIICERLRTIIGELMVVIKLRETNIIFP